MKKNILRFVKYALLLCIVIFLSKVFLPKKFNVPHLQKRESTRYWNLTTGSRIGYTLVSAKGEKKPYPIIYLHGGPGGPVTDRNIKMLSPLSEDGYDVYFYDQIGGGHSARLANIREYTADRHKRDLEEIVKQIGAEKVILVGQSWGAMLAVLFTADNPGRVEKIIFTGPGPVPPVNYELAKLKAPDSLHLKEPPYSNSQANEKVNTLRTRTIAWWARVFGKKLASDKEGDDFATSLNNELNKATVCDTSKALKAEGGGGYYVQVMTLETFSKVQDPRPKIRNSKIPVLIMKGQCDNQKWGYTNEYLALFSNHKLVIIPNAGHAISVEQPELYLKTIREFVHKEFH